MVAAQQLSVFLGSKKVVGSIPAGCWAFFFHYVLQLSFPSLLCNNSSEAQVNQVPKGGAALIHNCDLKEVFPVVLLEAKQA